jgi:hypothetical protein
LHLNCKQPLVLGLDTQHNSHTDEIAALREGVGVFTSFSSHNLGELFNVDLTKAVHLRIALGGK